MKNNNKLYLGVILAAITLAPFRFTANRFTKISIAVGWGLRQASSFSAHRVSVSSFPSWIRELAQPETQWHTAYKAREIRRRDRESYKHFKHVYKAKYHLVHLVVVRSPCICSAGFSNCDQNIVSGVMWYVSRDRCTDFQTSVRVRTSFLADWDLPLAGKCRREDEKVSIFAEKAPPRCTGRHLSFDSYCCL